MGCAPAGVRSMMASRRCDRATPASASLQTPAPSGPRCARASAMARARAVRSAVAPTRAGSIRPAMPHMSFGVVHAAFLAELFNTVFTIWNTCRN